MPLLPSSWAGSRRTPRYPKAVRTRLFTPQAILSHVLVGAVVVMCLAAGQWQLSRLAEVRAENVALAAQMAAPPLTFESLLAVPVDDLDQFAYRRVTVDGEYLPAEEVLHRNRQYNNQAGFHVLTPLRLSDTDTVLVRRGWVPAALDTPPVALAAPPAGQVTVTGVLELPVSPPRFGAQDAPEGRLERVFYADTARLDAQISGRLFPLVIRIDTEPGPFSADALPVTLGRPLLEERNHRSYAVQWHIFAVLATATYGAWWYTRLKRGAEPVTAGAA